MTRTTPRPLLSVLAALALILAALPVVGSSSRASADEIVTHGLKGEYFAMSEPGARDFAELGGVSLDPNIDHPSLVGTFQELTGQGEHTTARWTGQLTAPETGDYTFYAIGDNGFRVFLDDEPVIDHWVGDWDVEQTSEVIHLEAGETHDFRLEMFQDIGGANMFLRWSGPGLDKQIVPESAFTPPADFEIYPVELIGSEDGTTLTARFEGAVTAPAGVAEHLAIEVDTVPWPIGAVSVDANDPTTLVIGLDAQVQQGQRIKVSYDGLGGVEVDGEVVPEIMRNATNLSTHRLLTQWGEDLDTDNPLPEYPRPQEVREDWLNLNGPWEFASAEEGEEPSFGIPLDEEIIVPFPVESQLSGLERREDHMFYRRTIEVPQDWQIGDGQRLRLNFGAVDYEATVWVNGQQVAEHTGGYTAFSADITDALQGTGEQEIVVAVTDETGNDQPKGKQTLNPGGIMYTPNSGIWQTVWMEPVPDSSIDAVVSTPDLDTSTVEVTAESATAAEGSRVEISVTNDKGRTITKTRGEVNEPITVKLRKPTLWSPDNPYLYGLQVRLIDGESLDEVDSYFGMRSIEVQEVGGFPKLVLNGEPVFSLAMLDQGYFPDGLYTQPSDEALIFDLQAQKDLGFNAVRKHIKVEPMRWYFHADRMGLLVWQDFVSADITSVEGQEAFLTQGKEMMRQLRSVPSLIGWVVFNEGWGEWDRERTGEIAEEVKALDPTRITNAHSGVNCCASKGDSGKGEVIDHHDYTNEDPPFPDETRVAMDGEHGGFTLRTPGHMWPGAPAVIYSGVPDKAALTDKYVDNTETFYLEQAAHELSGSVYTQVTDLETELNGFYTYDRKELKVFPGPVRAINEAVIAAGASATDQDFPGQAHWEFNNGPDHKAKDSLGKSWAYLQGDATWVPGVSTRALSLDGDGDFAETRGPVVDTTGDYTVSAWVTLDELPGNFATAVSQDGRQKENPFYLQYGEGAFAFSLQGAERLRAPMTPELGTWHHLVGTRDATSGEIRLYVDGTLADSATVEHSSVSTGPLAIGRAKWNGGNTDWWNGAIDEVRVWDEALSGEEVADLFAQHAP